MLPASWKPSVGSKANLEKALMAPPRPLYHHPSRLMVIWSPKCACTQVVLWFFKQCGLLEAAEFYDSWPHRYRIDVLYNSQIYKDWIKAADPKEITAVQFGRHPVSRALSSYRQVLLWPILDKEMTRVLGRNVNHRKGFSLNDLLSYLERIELRTGGDPHVRLQARFASDVVPPRTVLLDQQDLHDTLNQLESEFGMPHTDFSQYSAFTRVEDTRRAKVKEQKPWSPDMPLARHNAWEDWPASVDQLDAETVARIERIYAPDFKLFGLEPKYTMKAKSS